MNLFSGIFCGVSGVILQAVLGNLFPFCSLMLGKFNYDGCFGCLVSYFETDLILKQNLRGHAAKKFNISLNLTSLSTVQIFGLNCVSNQCSMSYKFWVNSLHSSIQHFNHFSSSFPSTARDIILPCNRY